MAGNPRQNEIKTKPKGRNATLAAAEMDQVLEHAHELVDLL
ncbi:hypothetical protein [Natrinema sp. 74]